MEQFKPSLQPEIKSGMLKIIMTLPILTYRRIGKRLGSKRNKIWKMSETGVEYIVLVVAKLTVALPIHLFSPRQNGEINEERFKSECRKIPRFYFKSVVLRRVERINTSDVSAMDVQPVATGMAGERENINKIKIFN